MRNFKAPISCVVLALSLVVSLNAGDFKVIANASVPADKVSADDLKAVFLQTKSTLGGSHVVPVLEKSGVAHEAFLKKCVAKSEAALTAYYRSLVFTGEGSIPKALSSDEEVIAYVSNTKGAIGYIGGAAPAGVKVLEVK